LPAFSSSLDAYVSGHVQFAVRIGRSSGLVHVDVDVDLHGLQKTEDDDEI
jgi:hypothetical protein